MSMMMSERNANAHGQWRARRGMHSKWCACCADYTFSGADRSKDRRQVKRHEREVWRAELAAMMAE